MEPSEADHPLRNDGRSAHHRAELEKDVARLQRKVRAVKILSGGVESRHASEVLNAKAGTESHESATGGQRE
jgi:fructose-bisphosphate aldolase class 1